MRPAAVHDSILLVVDVQPKFMAPMADAAKVVARTKFLVQVANRLDVPIFVTEQNPEKMGGTAQEILDELPRNARVFQKMTFSACQAVGFDLARRSLQRKQFVVVGCETHICITQTTIDLLAADEDVFLAADAICARGADAHASALRRLTQAGAVESHTESIVYEWMRTAENAAFRDILALVKNS